MMVLPLFPEESIKTLYAEFERKIDNVDADTRAVYRHFKTVWLDTFPPSLWCQNDHIFRTNNFAESFHASLSRRLTQHHHQFNVLARHVVKMIKESRLRLDEERFNPKQRWRMGVVKRKLSALIENYLNGPPLALPLSDLVKTLFNTLHEKVPFEEAFEDDNEAECDDSSEVAMELVDE